MIVTFAGFPCGWSQLPFGPDALLTPGVVAAVVVTYFTFLPSFRHDRSANLISHSSL